jgi:cholesterol oxidase
VSGSDPDQFSVADERSAEGEASWDVVVVGSGFGGSVAALRAVEKGYRVLVLEAGRRWEDEDFPTNNWDPRKSLWAPALGLFGTWRLTLLDDVLAITAAGVGGGSLVYANTLYRPPTPFFRDPQWGHITDWEAELDAHYDQASRMLGVVENPMRTPADEAMLAVAKDMGVAESFRHTPIGVHVGRRAGVDVPDPYFGGAGPPRTTCTFCGSCMTGCRVGAKNTLRKNYLHLAEQAGARIVPMTTARGLRPLSGGGWEIDIQRTGWRGRGGRKRIRAQQVVLAAGTLGTARLLAAGRETGDLPRLSDRLGELVRTNSEALLAAARPRPAGDDHSVGVAISSSFHPDEHTHVEPVRFGKGHNLLTVLGTLMVDGDRPGEPSVPRWRRFLRVVAADPVGLARTFWLKGFSERGIVVLVMQSRDNSLRARWQQGRLGRHRLRTEQGHGEPNPTWIPVGAEATRRVAQKLDAEPLGSWTEVADIPVTAHILGGAVIGDSPQTGVVDPYQRVYGYEGLHVLDGAAVSANLGVNPSLTITAQAERAMSLWPNRGEADPRPPVGATYEALDPVAPRRPTVPHGAPGALVQRSAVPG